MIRINKFLASAGVCSRRKADELVQQGKVKINGRVAVLGDTVSETDQISVDNKPIKPQSEKIYIAFHKPFGAITTTDPHTENNVLSYIDLPGRIFPVGRLDVHSSGLLLFTNDGDFAQKILHASSNIEKEYLVNINKPLTDQAIHAMETGIRILKRHTAPTKVQKISNKQFILTLGEGRNRQIRRMCEALGYEVKILKRIRIGNIHLADLARGKWRYLTPQELANF